jgi:predicted translin family RNA/ssDNA-binding protein
MQYLAIVPDLQSLNQERYSSTITQGIQELIEALAFQHYAETMILLSYADASEKIAHLAGTDTLAIGPSVNDYLLGVLDMTGELMRYSITKIAVDKTVGIQEVMDTDLLPNDLARTILADLYELCSYIEKFRYHKGSTLERVLPNKIVVMRQSIIKVEKLLYGKSIRGVERPHGWLPEINSHGSEDATEV